MFPSARSGALLLFATCFAVAAIDCGAANIYKCRNKDGGVTVSNTPCARGAEPDAKLSSGGSATKPVYATPCERVEATGAGLVQLRSRMTVQQARAVDAEEFGRLNSAGASRILAEIGRNDVLRVCAFFPGGDHSETVIETSGLVRRDGVVDAADPVVAATKPMRSGVEVCGAQIDACRGRSSALDFSFEKCVHEIPTCGPSVQDQCCPKSCFDAYWKPPFDHAAGLAAMQSNGECRKGVVAN